MVSLKNHRREGSRSSCKNGGSPYRWRGGGSVEGGGGKHWFLWKIYGFCSSNALYSASLSFRMIIFILILFNLYLLDFLLFWMKSQPSVAYKSIFFKKKHVTLFFSVLKMKKWLCHISLFFCLSSISLGWYC